jgi:hypothetical protein
MFSAVFRERPPPARCATKLCTIFVVISGRWWSPSFGMMCARKCDSAARVALPFKLTATLVRHSSTIPQVSDRSAAVTSWPHHSLCRVRLQVPDAIEVTASPSYL